MRIGEVAKAAGVSTSRIRFYEEEGILPPAPREANGYRSYPTGTAILEGLKIKLDEVDRHLAATRRVRTQLAAFIREFDDCPAENCAAEITTLPKARRLA